MKLETSLRKVASAFYCHLNTPTSLACEIAMRYEAYGELANFAVQPIHYLEGPWGAEKFRRDSQAVNFLRKSPLLPLKGKSKVARAKETFYECEQQCRETNQMLRDMWRSPGVGEEPYQERLRHILCDAEKILRRVLGRLPDELNGRFGPGTSYELKGQTYSTVADKLWITPHATQDALELFEHDYWRTLWGRRRLELGLPLPTTVLGNRFTTVPKDATKDRGICIEPLGNLWGQLGVGGYIKRRLANVGLRVDRTSSPPCPLKRLTHRSVPTGKDIHMALAARGSLTGEWATIDLSNASDTVAFELVRWVTPPDWFELLSSLRSPFTLIDKKWVQLEKFSSMGNGTTFELETAIFAAILAAGLGLVIGQDLFVFGDDIVIPSHMNREAMAILRAVGFTPNMKKSFASGPFRESCGGDYFSGRDVRSVYADGSFESPLEWVALHNQLLDKWPGASLAAKRCVDAVPSRLRVFGPRFLGDQVLHGPPTKSWEEDGIRWVATIKVQPTYIKLDRWGDEFSLTCLLLGVGSNGITPRGEIEGYLISKASIS